MMDIKTLAKEQEAYIIGQRRHFHMYPELSKQEVQTTKHIVAELQKMGIEVQTFDNCLGCVGVIRGSRPGKTVMLRADIDALPISEPQNKPYASKNPGVMHACGHDCHMAMLLGAAKILSAHRDELNGTVKLLFQWAEETGDNAVIYVENGALDDVDAVFGMHVWLAMDAGFANFQDGERMASSDRFSITVKGRSAHAAAPHDGKDAIVAASAVVMALQSLVTRMNDPLNSLVLSMGAMNGGQKLNIIADTVELVGTVRTFNRAFRAAMPAKVEQMARDVAAGYGCTVECTYEFYPAPVINEHPELTRLAQGAAVAMLGEKSLVPLQKMMGADDFSGLMRKAPGVYGYIGARNAAKGLTATHHNPAFDIDEDILHSGAGIYARFAVDFLKG
ncbi:Peptidase, M20D family [uncultured delta proteobacterium]|uniref:Peptidase, M20D family n=1 Tax=uncultured delta proteobacterium TaxID=34034 RepID=A0A212JIV2_9DELT|nr:Peptidase, M20D family [uncultured delta proteobacterium]